MRIKCFAGIGWAVVGLLAGAAPATAVEPVGDPPAAMYEPGTIDVIRLTLPPASEQQLEKEPEVEYVEGTFSIASTGGTPQTTGSFSSPAMVGIRLKGGIGSFRDLHEKASFKVKFNFENSKGEKGKKYLGLKKLTLNNMVQDKSFIHERLAYEAFRSAGVPSPRTGYAYIEVNGEDFGLHLNIEALDDVALEKRFGPFGHLYEATYGSDVQHNPPGFEIDEGDEEDTADLNALIAAVSGTTPVDFLDRVNPNADLIEMIRMWAVERYIGHWDGYFATNNFYLLSDPTGRFRMLPWGTDQTWVKHVAFDEGGGLMFTKCLEDLRCAALYRKTLRQVRDAIDGASLDSLATETAALLEPWETMEQASPRHEVTMPAISTAVQQTKDFIASAPSELAAWLVGKSEVFATRVAIGIQPKSLPADGIATAIATATVTGADGKLIPGDRLGFSSTDPGISFDEVVDNGDGTYTVQITSSTTAGAQTITATDTWPNPDIAKSVVLTQTAGAAAHVSLALQPPSIFADGISTSTATATVTDVHGNPITGEQLEFASTDPSEQIGQVLDNGDGTYAAQITSSTAVGTATITATDTSADPVGDSALLTQLPIEPPVIQPPVLPVTGQEPPAQVSTFLAQAQSPPTTTLIRKPSRRSRDRRPIFRFVSDQEGSTFQCRLGRHAFESCESPHTLPTLTLGPHVFSVRAVSAGGLIGSPASYEFTVKPALSLRRPTGRRL
ncbi:MAG: hypothetical protein QOF13_218 [Solirubrobacterales bacterium]|jgi:hypothetical protein|nr:hypothetical protein [Solirubrobacterales bacterium]